MKKLLQVFEGKTLSPPPIWLMRQAGRYLPEYKQLRQNEKNFIEFCNNPELAKQATLQPLSRFQLDCAIIFSDILIIPQALGQNVEFVENVGPILSPLTEQTINNLAAKIAGEGIEEIINKLANNFAALKLVKAELDSDIALLGFCGAPWTLVCYMIGGKSEPSQMVVRDFALKNPQSFEKLIDILTIICGEFLLQQLESGADAMQIFDSWAGVLDEQQFNQWCIKPVAKIVGFVKQKNSAAKIIAFPRGIGAFYETYRQKTGVDMLSLDWTIPFAFGKKLQQQGAIQGNLDPQRLLVGGAALEQAINDILENFAKGPFVFNLGHGILPNTPIEHVEKMIKLVRQ